LISAFLDIQGD